MTCKYSGIYNSNYLAFQSLAMKVPDEGYSRNVTGHKILSLFIGSNIHGLCKIH